MELVLFIGIPGSGKSTFYKNNFFNSHLRINLDTLRTRNRESKLLEFCFKTSMPFVVDNTNVSRHDRKHYIQLAKANRYTVRAYFFKSDIEECVIRNELRVEKEKVPLKGMLAKLKRLQPPDFSEGFDTIYFVELVDGKYVIEEKVREDYLD